MLSAHSHVSSMVTLSLEAIAKKPPDVSSTHDYPSAVNTGQARGAEGGGVSVIKVVFWIVGPFIYMSILECEDRQLFLATSARYIPSEY